MFISYRSFTPRSLLKERCQWRTQWTSIEIYIWPSPDIACFASLSLSLSSRPLSFFLWPSRDIPCFASGWKCYSSFEPRPLCSHCWPAPMIVILIIVIIITTPSCIITRNIIPNHHNIILYVVQEADAVRNRKKYTSINIEHQLLACRENDLARSLAGSTSDTVWKSFSTWEASSRRDVFRPRSDIPPFEIHSSPSFTEAGSKQLLNLIPFLRHC